MNQTNNSVANTAFSNEVSPQATETDPKCTAVTENVDVEHACILSVPYATYCEFKSSQIQITQKLFALEVKIIDQPIFYE